MAKVICFVDGLPYYHKRLVDAGLNVSSGSISSGLGFSSNQHCFLVGGKSPDDMEFFTDWTLSENPLYYGKYLKHKNKVSYVLNKLLGKIFGFSHSIPLGLHSVFTEKAVYPLKSIESLSDFNPHFKDWNFYIDDGAIEFLDKGQIADKSFLVINKIDALGHYKGARSEDYLYELKTLMQKLKYLANSEDVDFLMFSDHGMSIKPQAVRLYLEDYFGRQGLNTYFYFMDSTTLKVWSSDLDKLCAISDYLSKQEYGVLLDADKREHYGITNASFGDLIFILKNDWYFADHYFGKGWKSKTLGMHGNWPDHPEQFGLFASNRVNGAPETTKDFYKNILKPFLNL